MGQFVFELQQIQLFQTKNMQHRYSEKLKRRLAEYFKRSRNLNVTDETADEWLDSLADLFLIFASIKKDNCNKC